MQLEPVALKEITLMQAGSHYVALWMGCLIVGLCLSIGSHFLISFMWRSQVRQRWRRRRFMRLERKKD